MSAAEVNGRDPVFWALLVASVTVDRETVAWRMVVPLSSAITSHLMGRAHLSNQMSIYICARTFLQGSVICIGFFSKSDFRIYYKGTELCHRRGLVFLIRSDHGLESCQLRFGHCQI